VGRGLKKNHGIGMFKSMKLLGISLLPILFLTFSAQTAKAENFTWLVKSKYPYKVSVAFYSRHRKYSWPGGTKVWVISDSATHEYTLSCRLGEKVCFGAWVRGNKRRWWGVGYRGKRGCRKCCYTCNGGESRVQVLNR